MKEFQLGEFARKTKTVNPKNFPDETFDLLSIPAFDRGEPEIASGNEIGSAKQLVSPGDVLIAKIVPHIQRVWVVPKADSRRQIASGEWIVFRNPEVDPSWLRQLLLSQTFHRKFMQTVAGVGGSLLRARPVDVFKIPITVPPIKDQQRIADILDKADALRDKRREAIAHLDSLGQSIFHEMFGSPSTNDRGWEVRRLGEMLVSTQYGTSEKSVPIGTVPVLRMGNLTYEGALDLSDLKYLAQESVDLEKYRLMPGDVLFNRTNSAELVGKTAMFSEEGDYTFAGYLIRLRCGPDLNPAYLSAFMNTADVKTKLRSMCKSIVGMANINAKEVQTIEVMLPPLVLQQEFANRLDAVSRLRDRYQAQSVELSDLFLSLQDRAFKGDL